MTIASAAQLAGTLRQFRILEPDELAQLDELAARCDEPKALAKELLDRGWLTPFQANHLLQGKAAELVLGSYVLLERLGEGGMGTVLKARHMTLGRVVALKLIRKERVVHPMAAKRFRREIRAAAQCNHPNIVLAFDADEAAGAHFFTMEYVPGTDLAKVVKEQGRLPVDRACDYVRQAALGLQHAHEKGLIHRDIKPSNLLLTPDGLVKVLDLGLARATEVPGQEASSTLTEMGVVMGTPDFIAPEQARDANDVDIRADLYSLGCTLYYLLAGRVPFPTIAITSKLVHHQMDEPVPIEKLRPEVPPAVATALRKLMAKRREDRYQTPAEAAQALVIATDPTPARDLPSTVAIPPARGVVRKQQQRRRWRLLVGSGAVLLLLSLAGLIWLLTQPNRMAGVTSGPARSEPGESPLEALAEFLVKTTDGHSKACRYLAFSPDSRLLASVGDEKEICVCLWDVPDLRMRAKFDQCAAVAFAPRSPTLALALGGKERAIQLTDLAGAPLKGRPTFVLGAGGASVTCLAFSPDGGTLATAAIRGGEGNLGKVTLWDTATGTEGSTLQEDEGRVFSLAFSPDGQLLACNGRRKWIWDVAGATPQLRAGTTGTGIGTAPIRFLPDGKTVVAITKSEVVQYQVAQGGLTAQARFPGQAAALSPDGRILVTGGADPKIHLWELATGKDLYSFPFADPVRNLEISPDGKLLAIGTETGGIVLYRLPECCSFCHTP